MVFKQHEEKWVDVDDVRTRYVAAGTGRTVVLVHGGTMGDASGGNSAEDFQLNFAALAQRFHVIALDRLGQGVTGNPTSDQDWTMAAAVRHVKRFLRTLAVGPYNLVGHSRGGYVVTRVTLDEPALVESCVIVDSNTVAPGPGRNDVVFATNPHQPGTLEAARFIAEHYSYRPDHISEDWLQHAQDLNSAAKTQAAIAKMSGEGLLVTRFLPELVDDRDDLFARLDSTGLERPTLLVWGYNDPTAPLAQGLALYDLIAKHQHRTQLHVFNQAGHYSFRERPTAFNRVVTEFIEGVGYGN